MATMEINCFLNAEMRNEGFWGVHCTVTGNRWAERVQTRVENPNRVLIQNHFHFVWISIPLMDLNVSIFAQMRMDNISKHLSSSKIQKDSLIEIRINRIIIKWNQNLQKQAAFQLHLVILFFMHGSVLSPLTYLVNKHFRGCQKNEFALS